MASPHVAEDSKAGEKDREDQPEVTVRWKTCYHGDGDLGLEERSSRAGVSVRDSRHGSLGDFASRTIHQADAPLAPKSILKNQPAQNGPDHVLIPGTIFSILVKAVRRELMYSTAPHGARALGNERTLTYNSCER